MRDSYVFYRSFYEAIKSLSDNQRLQIYDAICEYALNQNLTKTEEMANVIFTLIKPQIDANYRRYLNGKKPKLKRKSSKTEAKTKQDGSETISENEANENVNVNVNVNDNVNVINNSRFKKPTIEEIKQYCSERNNNVDPQTFFDFYEAKGWYVGKNKMKDWRACVRTWETNRQSKQPEAIKPIYDDSNNIKFDEEAYKEIMRNLGREDEL